MTTKSALFFILLLLFFIFIGPVFTIWSLNTIFGLGIALTFKTWLATFWLTLIVAGAKYNSKK